MRSFRRFFLWYGLLSKRLLKRPAYLAVLLLIPLFALAISLFSRQDSGALTIALSVEDQSDPLAAAITDRLLSGDSILAPSGGSPTSGTSRRTPPRSALRCATRPGRLYCAAFHAFVGESHPDAYAWQKSSTMN